MGTKKIDFEATSQNLHESSHSVEFRINSQITITIDAEDLSRVSQVNFKVRYYKQSPLIDVTYHDTQTGKLARMSLGRFILNPGSDEKCVYFKNEGQRLDYRKSNLILITRQEYALRKPKTLAF